jgi:hypothetical protein
MKHQISEVEGEFVCSCGRDFPSPGSAQDHLEEMKAEEAENRRLESQSRAWWL